jgi:hypothetical protein
MARKVAISIKPADDVLQRYGNMLGALGQKKGNIALARAINRVTNTVHSRVSSAVAKQTSLPVGRIKREIKKRLARPGAVGAIEGHVWARGAPLTLREFKPKQFSWGVRAKVWGRTQRFPSAFIFAGTYRSGKFVGSGHAFVRTSSKSRPIEKMFGPSIPEEMVKDESKRVFETTVATMLPVRVAHEVGRLLKV